MTRSRACVPYKSCVHGPPRYSISSTHSAALCSILRYCPDTAAILPTEDPLDASPPCSKSVLLHESLDLLRRLPGRDCRVQNSAQCVQVMTGQSPPRRALGVEMSKSAVARLLLGDVEGVCNMQETIDRCTRIEPRARPKIGDVMEILQQRQPSTMLLSATTGPVRNVVVAHASKM